MRAQLKQIGTLVGRWFALIVVMAGGLALWQPNLFAGWTVAIPWLLALIMLGMGMTIRLSDLRILVRRPWALILGVAAQYSAMPLLGLGLAYAFDLSPDLATGMVLVGAVPGGTASNVMVFLSRGDTALSVAMTTVSTVIAPLLTPLLVLLLAGRFLPVDASALFTSIVQIVLAPVLIGLTVRGLAPAVVERLSDVLPLVSVAGITAVVLAVVAASSATVTSVGLVVVVAVIAHNVLGYGLGYAIATACSMPISSRRAVSIEVGMQNSGLAAALATVHFNPVAALPAAFFSVWHNVSGSMLASYWASKPTPLVTEKGRRLSPNGDVLQDNR